MDRAFEAGCPVTPEAEGRLVVQDPTTFFEILGVPVDATSQDIREAYKQQCRLHHPDKGGNQQRFDLICLAYKVLGDPQLRRIYETSGEDGVADFFTNGVDTEHADDQDQANDHDQHDHQGEAHTPPEPLDLRKMGERWLAACVAGEEKTRRQAAQRGDVPGVRRIPTRIDPQAQRRSSAPARCRKTDRTRSKPRVVTDVEKLQQLTASQQVLAQQAAERARVPRPVGARALGARLLGARAGLKRRTRTPSPDCDGPQSPPRRPSPDFDGARKPRPRGARLLGARLLGARDGRNRRPRTPSPDFDGLQSRPRTPSPDFDGPPEKVMIRGAGGRFCRVGDSGQSASPSVEGSSELPPKRTVRSASSAGQPASSRLRGPPVSVKRRSLQQQQQQAAQRGRSDASRLPSTSKQSSGDRRTLSASTPATTTQRRSVPLQHPRRLAAPTTASGAAAAAAIQQVLRRRPGPAAPRADAAAAPTTGPAGSSARGLPRRVGGRWPPLRAGSARVIEEAVEESLDESEDLDEIDFEPATPPPKRGRGRPPLVRARASGAEKRSARAVKQVLQEKLDEFDHESTEDDFAEYSQDDIIEKGRCTVSKQTKARFTFARTAPAREASAQLHFAIRSAASKTESVKRESSIMESRPRLAVAPRLRLKPVSGRGRGRPPLEQHEFLKHRKKIVVKGVTYPRVVPMGTPFLGSGWVRVEDIMREGTEAGPRQLDKAVRVQARMMAGNDPDEAEQRQKQLHRKRKAEQRYKQPQPKRKAACRPPVAGTKWRDSLRPSGSAPLMKRPARL